MRHLKCLLNVVPNSLAASICCQRTQKDFFSAIVNANEEFFSIFAFAN